MKRDRTGIRELKSILDGLSGNKTCAHVTSAPTRLFFNPANGVAMDTIVDFSPPSFEREHCNRDVVRRMPATDTTMFRRTRRLASPVAVPVASVGILSRHKIVMGIASLTVVAVIAFALAFALAPSAEPAVMVSQTTRAPSAVPSSAFLARNDSTEMDSIHRRARVGREPAAQSRRRYRRAKKSNRHKRRVVLSNVEFLPMN